jgi:hypothetical protein
VVADRADVEVHPVDRRDRGQVVEVARDQRRRSDHVPRVHADRALRPAGRGAVQGGGEPGGAAETVRGLEVPVQVVDAKELDPGLARPGRALRRAGSGAQTEQRDERSNHESSDARGQVTAIDQLGTPTYGRTKALVLRVFVGRVTWP